MYLSKRAVASHRGVARCTAHIAPLFIARTLLAHRTIHHSSADEPRLQFRRRQSSRECLSLEVYYEENGQCG